MRRALPYLFLMAGVGMACGDAFTQSGPGDDTGDDASTVDGSGDDDTGDDQMIVTPEAGHDAAHPKDAGEEAAPDDAADDVTTVGLDATVPIPDASPDVSQGMDATTLMDVSQPMDVAMPPPTDACTGEVADEATGYFVAPGGPSSSCGSRANPCGTVQSAIDLASQNGLTNVYVAAGTYVEQVTLASNIAVQGGWNDSGGAWTRDCLSRAFTDVTIQAPAGVAATVVANGVSNATLDTLSVASMAQSSVGAGQSVYGIFVVGGSIIDVTNVEVSVVAGGAGAVGTAGGNGTSATAQCSPPSTGGAGQAGSVGSAGLAGTFDATGYTPASAGAGGTGGTGATGTAAPAQGASGGPTCAGGQPSSTCATDFSTPPGSCPATLGGSACGSVGSSGCGGTGAGGGGPGQGGGSSIALYVWASTVVIDGGGLSAGTGGAGGPGGAAGATPGSGAPGLMGMGGEAVSPGCTSGTNPNPPHNATCTPKATSVGAPGAAGGAGGSGGAGGAGGGGAGGNSYAYYAGATGIVQVSGVTLLNSTGGLGGAGGNSSNGGPNGTGAQHN